MADYIDFIRYLQNVSSKLPKTAGNKANNTIRRMQELTKINNNNNVINTTKDAFKPKANNAKTFDDLFGNGYTKTSATDKLNKTIRPNMTKGMHAAEGATKAGKYAKVIGEGLKLAPIIGGGWDTYSGIHKIMHGNPVWGTGQTLFGLGELVSDIGAAAAIPFTGGGSEAAETTGRMALRTAMKAAYRKALKAGATKEGAVLYAKLMSSPQFLKLKGMQGIKKTGDFLQSAPGNILATAAFEIPSFVSDNFTPHGEGNGGEGTPPNNNDSNGNKEPNNGNNGGSGGYNVVPVDYKNPGALYGGYNTNTGLTNNIIKETGDEANTDANSNKITDSKTESEVNSIPNAYDVLDEWRKRQEYYDAYRNSLLNYRNNYRNLYEQTYARNKALEGMKDFGNPSAGTYTSSMSPLDLETNEVNLDKTIADEMVKPSDEYQELLGGIALANQMGLPPEVMRTDTKRFDSAIDYMRAKDTAQLNNITRQYIANQNNTTKLMKLQLDKEIAQAKLEGDWRKVQYLGGLKYQMNLQDNETRRLNAMVGAAPWYQDTQTLLDTLDALGYATQKKQSQAQQVQPINQQTVRANTSVQATPNNKDSNLGKAFGKYSGR